MKIAQEIANNYNKLQELLGSDLRIDCKEKKECDHNWFDNSLEHTCICEVCRISYNEFYSV